MAEWFDVIRWLGAVYLAVLGALQLRAWWRKRGTPPGVVTAIDRKHAGGLYLQGLAVSLSNPKVLLFLGAFLPQFVDTTRAPLPQCVRHYPRVHRVRAAPTRNGSLVPQSNPARPACSLNLPRHSGGPKRRR